jgi:hypothetical protein
METGRVEPIPPGALPLSLALYGVKLDESQRSSHGEGYFRV